VRDKKLYHSLEIEPYRIVAEWGNPRVGKVTICFPDDTTAMWWWEVLKASAEILGEIYYPVYKMTGTRIQTNRCPTTMVLEANLTSPNIIVKAEINED
jgi:hypothetical protein